MSKKTKRSKDHESEPKPVKVDTSPYVPDQRKKLDWHLGIRGRNDLTDRQKAIIDLILHKETKVVFLTGPAGTSKTWLAVYCGLLLLQQKRMGQMTYVRTVIESASKSLGALPGVQEEKMQPYLMPLRDKLDEMLSAGEVKKLMAEEWAVAIPINYLRGASLTNQFIISDESQNYTVKELTTLLTRIGQFSKMVIIGDPDQCDLANNGSGLRPLADWFNQSSHQEHGIHCITLTDDDIVRSGTVRYLAGELARYRAAHPLVKAH